VDGPRDEGGQKDASGAALAFTYSIESLRELLRAEKAMVKRSAKAHFLFLNMGCPSIEIERKHLAIHSMMQFDRTAPKLKKASWQAPASAATQRKRGGALLPRLRFTKDASSFATNFFRPGV
jgi:hypothetical protein